MQVPVYVCDMGELAHLRAVRISSEYGGTYIMVDSGQDDETIARLIGELLAEGEADEVIGQRQRPRSVA